MNATTVPRDGLLTANCNSSAIHIIHDGNTTFLEIWYRHQPYYMIWHVRLDNNVRVPASQNKAWHGAVWCNCSITPSKVICRMTTRANVPEALCFLTIISSWGGVYGRRLSQRWGVFWESSRVPAPPGAIHNTTIVSYVPRGDTNTNGAPSHPQQHSSTSTGTGTCDNRCLLRMASETTQILSLSDSLKRMPPPRQLHHPPGAFTPTMWKRGTLLAVTRGVSVFSLGVLLLSTVFGWKIKYEVYTYI